MDNRSVGTLIIVAIASYLFFLGGRAYEESKHEAFVKKQIQTIKLISESMDRSLNACLLVH